MESLVVYIKAYSASAARSGAWDCQNAALEAKDAKSCWGGTDLYRVTITAEPMRTRSKSKAKGKRK